MGIMRILIDTELNVLEIEENNGKRRLGLYTKEAFEAISRLWVKVGWNEKYQYTFSWLGRPIIQLPEDVLRMQEAIYSLKPDVIVETGVAHGGSLILWASLCKAIGKGRVVGIDIDIRPANRNAIESHELFPWITLIQGDSTQPEIVERVKSMISANDVVLVILDSDHSKKHVRAELEIYHKIVSPGSYIVATDGIMQDLFDSPRGRPEWLTDNPAQAAIEFAQHHPDFVIRQPMWQFNESSLDKNITHWPGAWLLRLER
jgi:cephalosporin hydroxylase